MSQPKAPRIKLAVTPTPLQHLPRLSAHTGVDFWLKREDLSGDVGLGGNKVRKLEYLLAAAVSEGATHVLTTGGPQSNHARATAAAAARLGLDCVLVLAGPDPGERRGNLLLAEAFGADIRFPGARTAADQARSLAEAAAELKTHGARPYVVPIGGSTALGTLGSHHSYEELAGSLTPGAWLCCASGTGGTHAGLALGAALTGAKVHIQAFSVWQGRSYLLPITANLISGAARLLGQTPPGPGLNIDDAFLGPRYGKASPEGEAALNLVARLEGILLDPVYTAKAMAGVLAYIHAGRIQQGTRVIFLHTGGVPAVFSRA